MVMFRGNNSPASSRRVPARPAKLFRLTFREKFNHPNPNPFRRLAKLLKAAKRQHGFECINVEESEKTKDPEAKDYARRLAEALARRQARQADAGSGRDGQNCTVARSA